MQNIPLRKCLVQLHISVFCFAVLTIVYIETVIFINVPPRQDRNSSSCWKAQLLGSLSQGTRPYLSRSARLSASCAATGWWGEVGNKDRRYSVFVAPGVCACLLGCVSSHGSGHLESMQGQKSLFDWPAIKEGQVTRVIRCGPRFANKAPEGHQSLLRPCRFSLTLRLLYSIKARQGSIQKSLGYFC